MFKAATICLALFCLAADTLTPLGVGDVRVGGEIGRRIDVTIQNNLLVLDADKDFLAPFEQRNRGDGYIGLGKLIDSAVTLAAHTRDANATALKDRLIEHILKHQEPDGYVGLLKPDSRVSGLWDVHEIQYIAWGLLRNHELFGHAPSLAAARKIADYLIANWSKVPDDWGQRTGVATHVVVTGLERTVLALHRITGDARYLEFVTKQRQLPEWDLPIIIGRRPGIEGHIYAYMARCLAQLELYRAAPDPRLLRPTRRAMEFMLKNDGLSITGGCGQWEIWTDDQDGRGELGETCATAYQLRVYDALLRQNADATLGDLMERTIHNALFAAQSPDGRQLRYFAPTEGPRVYHPTDTYCCPCNYRRIVAELPAFIYYTDAVGVVVNLYADSQAKLRAGGVDVAIRQETTYPSSGQVKIQVEPAAPAAFALRLRIPAWAKGAKATVNGDSVVGEIKPGTFLTIRREWKAGDAVSLDMPMEFRLVSGRQRQAGRVAVMRGPLLFCLDPAQQKALEEMDGADLGRITLDPSSLSAVPDATVRPDGIACQVQAWHSGFGLGAKGDFVLKLTEFADPEGKQTYFRLRDMSPAVDDELLALAATPAKPVPAFTDVFIADEGGYPIYRIPSLVVARSGAVLAFAEGRATRSDHAENDIVLRRSVDGGRTWSAVQVVAEDGANCLNNPCAVVLRESGRVLLMYQRYPKGIHEAQVMAGLEGDRICRSFITHSDDEGKTWSPPVDITAQVKRPIVATSIAGGPGVGIQLRHGRHAGRIIMPFNQGPLARCQVYAVYSDDGGKSWRMGDIAPEGPAGRGNEVQMVELADGRVMLNTRGSSGAAFRKIATSPDGGQTWSELVDDPNLPEPRCQASLIRHGDLLLFANPASQKTRSAGTVRVSRDDGRTWPASRELAADSFAYSCLGVLPDGTVLCLFERDGYRRITLARFAVEWLEGGR